MGNSNTKGNIDFPKADFILNCLKQGFKHTSPPIGFNSDVVSTIDIDQDNNIYYVERYTDEWLNRKGVKAPHLFKKYKVSIEANKHSDTLTIIINKDGYCNVLVGQQMFEGEIHIYSDEERCTLHKSFYTHEYFPKFKRVGHPEYDRLARLFEEQYGIICEDKIE